MSRSRIAVAATAVLAVSTLTALAAPSQSSAAPPPAAAASAPPEADAVGIARTHLAERADRYDLSGSDLKGLTVSSVVPVDDLAKVVHLQQTVDAIDVSQALVSVTVGKDGKVFEVASSAVTGAAKQANNSDPAISDLRAAAEAADALGLDPEGDFASRQDATGADQSRALGSNGIANSKIPVQLVYEPTEDDGLRLAWQLEIDQLDGEHWWQIRIDADTGAELDKTDFVDEDSYNVYADPVEAPSFGGRSIVSNPATAPASPFGWHDTNGSPGAESTQTIGNNATAYIDADNNNAPDAGSQPSGGGGLSFNFPLDLTQDPTAYQPAAVTNLFFWNNRIHDILYRYGFNEASGNFQANNYGEGGTGSDAVNAEAQDGGGTNNANFATPPDGAAPRMQMYLWNLSTPRRDGDLDNGIIVHEYAHGISNRLTGGPAQAGCLGNADQAGEGWSDYYGYMLTMPNGTEPAGGRGIGTYALNQAPSGPGIRAQKYSTSTAINTMTYNTTRTAAVPHGVGTVWAEMLWEMTYALIGKHGFNADLVNGNAGNNISLQLVTDGLKLQPCSPGFVDARNAILQADQLRYGGENACLIWTAFAKRGLGFSATQGSVSSNADNTEAFDMPPSCGFGMVLTDRTDPVEAGDYIHYDFTVRNNDNTDKTNVRIPFTLTGAVHIDFASGSCVSAAKGVREETPAELDESAVFNLGTVPGGAVYDCTFRAQTDPTPFGEVALDDDFEGGFANWSATHGSGGSDWAITTSNPASPTKAALSVGPGSVSDQYLTSNPMTVPAGSPTLSFANNHQLETNFDGGVVEISTDNGGSWTDLGPSFTQNGYTGTINANTGSPLAGRSAFTSSTNGYKTSVADLSAYAGQTVRIRFRMGTDSSVSSAGWRVDDVVIGSPVYVVNNGALQSDQTTPQPYTERTSVVEPTTSVPAAPTITSQEPQSSTRTKVAFTPGSDGGSPITKYLVNCVSSDGGTARGSAGAASPRYVKNMTTGKTYKCRVRAFNSVGAGPYSAYGPSFVQESVPTKPTVDSESIENSTTIRLHFSPGDDGGRPITGYQARCESSDGGSARAASGSSSPLTLSNLTNGKTYTCRVRATNSLGTGAYSNPGAPFVMALRAPGKPVVTSQTPTGPTTATVAFTLEDTGGAPVSSFQVRCDSSDGGTNGVKTGPTSPVNLGGLSSGKSYRCHVRATNVRGTGPFGPYGVRFVMP